MNEIDSLEAFVAVAECGSFNLAARRLDGSNALMTRRIAKLEQRLGVRLIDRNTRHQTLTEEGVIFLQRTRAFLADLVCLEQAVKTQNYEISGTLRLVVSGDVPFTPIVRSLRCAYPAVQIAVKIVADSSELESGGFDAALVVNYDEEIPGYVNQTIGHVPMVVCASSVYVAIHGAPEHPGDLDGALAVGTDSSSIAIWKLVAANGAEITAAVDVLLAADTLEHVRKAAMAGIGAALLPASLIAEELRSGALVNLLPDYTASTSISVVYPDRRYLPRRTRVFCEAVNAHFAPLEATMCTDAHLESDSVESMSVVEPDAVRTAA